MSQAVYARIDWATGANGASPTPSFAHTAMHCAGGHKPRLRCDVCLVSQRRDGSSSIAIVPSIVPSTPSLASNASSRPKRASSMTRLDSRANAALSPAPPGVLTPRLHQPTVPGTTPSFPLARSFLIPPRASAPYREGTSQQIEEQWKHMNRIRGAVVHVSPLLY